jgi:hypothetical protein
MKTIIAGSRAIGRLSRQTWDYERLVALIDEAVRQSEISITQIISGGAGGPDRAGEMWAAENDIEIVSMKPNWALGRGAGLIRNSEMVERAEALIALYDGQSTGTRDTIAKMRRKSSKVFVLHTIA